MICTPINIEYTSPQWLKYWAYIGLMPFLCGLCIVQFVLIAFQAYSRLLLPHFPPFRW